MKNEPAFPLGYSRTWDTGEREDYYAEGLTKREYFAAAIIQGITASRRQMYSSRDDIIEAVKMADALLAELSKNEGEEK